MDKDQVLAAINRGAEVSHKNRCFNTSELLDNAHAQMVSDYAELESLRAMRKRVEGLAQDICVAIENVGLVYEAGGDIDELLLRAEALVPELRKALGDSYEN